MVEAKSLPSLHKACFRQIATPVLIPRQCSLSSSPKNNFQNLPLCETKQHGKGLWKKKRSHATAKIAPTIAMRTMNVSVRHAFQSAWRFARTSHVWKTSKARKQSKGS